MKGYWSMPQETELVLRNGWLYTGDIARMDEEGYFQIVDRKKDMIIAGGFNIYPRDVEEVLYQHPKVQEAVVAGIPHPYRGETVKAYVVLSREKKLHPKRSSSSVRSGWPSTRCQRPSSFVHRCPRPLWARSCAACWWKRNSASNHRARSRCHGSDSPAMFRLVRPLRSTGGHTP